MDQTFDDVSIQIAAATQQLASVKADVSTRAAVTPEWQAALVHKLEALGRTNGAVASAFEKAKAAYFEQQTRWARLPRPDTPAPPS